MVAEDAPAQPAAPAPARGMFGPNAGPRMRPGDRWLRPVFDADAYFQHLVDGFDDGRNRLTLMLLEQIDMVVEDRRRTGKDVPDEFVRKVEHLRAELEAVAAIEDGLGGMALGDDAPRE